MTTAMQIFQNYSLGSAERFNCKLFEGKEILQLKLHLKKIDLMGWKEPLLNFDYF